MFFILKWRDNKWVYYDSGILFKLCKEDLWSSNESLSEIVELVIQWVSLILDIYNVGTYNLLVISLRYSVISI